MEEAHANSMFIHLTFKSHNHRPAALSRCDTFVGRMLREAAAVVIGSGALGCSVAYHLAKSGVAPVALIDKHEIASQTSPRAAGLSSQLRKSELMTRLAVMGVEKIKGFAAETGEEMVYFQPGSLRIARIADHEQQLRRDVELGRRLGVDIDFVSPAKAS